MGIMSHMVYEKISATSLERHISTLSEEERKQLALNLVKESGFGETAEYEKEGFNITWYVQQVHDTWYKVYFRGVSENGTCGCANIYVNILTKEIFFDNTVELTY